MVVGEIAPSRVKMGPQTSRWLDLGESSSHPPSEARGEVGGDGEYVGSGGESEPTGGVCSGEAATSILGVVSTAASLA